MTIHPNPQLNDADLELLSAYIDRRLDDGERAALERRLNAEPALRGALEDLRATVALLRDLEPLKPPRSFTIATPAAAPRRAWSFPWPAIGSALIAMVCLLTFSYVLTRGGGGAGSPASAPAAMEAAAPTAAPAAAGAAPEQAMRQSAAPTPSTSSGQGAAPAAEAPTAVAAEAPATPMAAAAPTAAPAAEAPTAAAAVALTPTPAATIGPEPSALPAEAPVVAAAPTAPPEPSVATAADQPSEPALPAAVDSAVTTEVASTQAATPESAPAGAQGNAQSTVPTSQESYNAQAATSEISPPETITLEQPPIAPAAGSAPSGGSSSAWLIAGVVALLVIGVGVVLALRRRGSE